MFTPVTVFNAVPLGITVPTFDVELIPNGVAVVFTVVAPLVVVVPIWEFALTPFGKILAPPLSVAMLIDEEVDTPIALIVDDVVNEAGPVDDVDCVPLLIIFAFPLTTGGFPTIDTDCELLLTVAPPDVVLVPI